MAKNPVPVPVPASLNLVTLTTTRRSNNSTRIQQDFSNCPSMAEQHTADATDINVLMERFQPDELASYIAARSAHKQEIIGHDFSQEPNLQDANNIVYKIRQNYLALPDEIRNHFKSPVEFLKFIDNPANQEKMIRMGLLTKKEIVNLTSGNERLTNESDAGRQTSDSSPTPDPKP